MPAPLCSDFGSDSVLKGNKLVLFDKAIDDKYDDGELAVTAELEDIKGRSTATVRIDRLRFENKEDKENGTEIRNTDGV